MPIALQEPLWLLAAVPVAALLWSQRSDRPDRQRRRLLWVRGSLLIAVVLALAEPVATWRTRELDVAVLVDVSASIEPASLNRALEAIESGLGPDGPARLFAYADRAATVAGAADLRRLEVADSSTASAGAAALDRGNTRPGAALRQAAATLRPDRVRRVLLLSDGQRLAGVGARVVAEYPDLRVDTAALGRTAPPVWIESVELDESDRPLHAGEPHSWVLRLGSRSSLPEAPLILRGGGAEERHSVALSPGVTTVELEWTFAEPGIQTFEAVLGTGEGAAASRAASEGAMWRGSLRIVAPHRVLLLAPQNHSADLQRLLQAQGLRVIRSTPSRAALSPSSLRSYDAVVLSNVAADSLPEPAQRVLGEWVSEEGGGLLFVAGEETFGEEGYRNSPLERVLPLDFEIEEERSEVALMIALDKSYSMKGPKMDLAKEAAKAALGMLNEQHRFGLVAFDWHTHDIVGLQFVRDQERLNQRVDRIEASAQTNFYPALEACLEQLSEVESEVKHVILVSDGRTYPDEYEQLVLRMRQEEITVSTVAIGVESDRELLADIADWGDGNAYTIEDPSSVQSILIDETMNQLPDSAREETILVELRGQSDALTGVDVASAPELYGRIAAVAKDSAEVILGAGESDPILASRYVGLGKTWMFTSDLEPRWASDWLRWPELGRLVAQVVRDAADRRAGAEWEFDLDRRDEVLEAALSVVEEDGRFGSDLSPRLVVLRGDRRIEAPLQRTGPGLYRLVSGEGMLLAPSLEPYRVEVHTGPAGAAETIGPGRTIFYPARDELRPGAPDIAALAELAVETSGLFHETVAAAVGAITAPSADTAVRRFDLWSVLLVAATLLFLAELLLRRRRRHGASTVIPAPAETRPAA
ncbi:MAG: VWA domain-containing protein [Holophagales bacterium]|nr:VWA domain-containing protein [Holophagales bacterium]MYC11675.1 VWA domain-containing protein [Holophagales bacterium]